MADNPNDPLIMPAIQTQSGEWLKTTSEAVTWLERWLDGDQRDVERALEVRNLQVLLRDYWGRKASQLPDDVRKRLAELVARMPFK